MTIRVWAEHTANPGRRCRDATANPDDVIAFTGTRTELAATARALTYKRREFCQVTGFTIRLELGLVLKDGMREFHQENSSVESGR